MLDRRNIKMLRQDRCANLLRFVMFEKVYGMVLLIRFLLRKKNRMSDMAPQSSGIDPLNELSLKSSKTSLVND